MDHVTARFKVISDNTGVATEIPVIVLESGPLLPLVDYLLEHSRTRSFSWMIKVTQGVGLFLDYMSANQDCFDDPKKLFKTFMLRLETGTIGEDGYDPSGLGWFGMRASTGRQLTYSLSEFFNWMAENYGTKPVNPWREATNYEEKLNWAAWHQKHNRAFLGHTWSREGASSVVKRARAMMKRAPVVNCEGVKFFPEDRFNDLLSRGFIVPGKQKSRRIQERLNLRDILITMLMHYGGLRISEPFHLYVHDVMPDPADRSRAYVRIFHPSEGDAPPDWLDAKGKPIECKREAYLRSKYGLRPRNMYYLSDQLCAGWKNNALDSKKNYIDVHWFPLWSGEMFLKIWTLYMIQRIQKACDHPFAFVTAEGKPYAIDSFMFAHRRAVERIGLTPAKDLGTTPHGHRHAYGQRLQRLDVTKPTIKKAMHHASIESQEVYTEASNAKVMRELDAAMARLEAGQSQAPDFLSFGFEDVDSLGLFYNPKK